MKYPLSVLLLTAFLACLVTSLKAQFTTATPDGVINPGEYGNHTNGQNQQFEGGTTWYMCWDANNLYLAASGTNFNEGATVYLDRNPILPVNGGTNANGSLQGNYTYDRNHMMQPFRADFVVYFKNGYHEFRYADGAGYWGGATANTLATGTNGGTNTVEIAIPWNTVTQGTGRPAEFNYFAYKSYDYGAGTNGIYHSVPVGNPNCACNQDPSRLFATRYYNVLSTGNGSSTPPFSLTSFTYYEDFSTPGTGGYYLANSSFYDLTINDNSLTNTDNDPANRLNDNLDISNRVLVEGSINISHFLYVGQGSALLPNNSAGNVLADLNFTGSSGSIYNFGRIDANPEASNLNDWNTRRINFNFSGNTKLMQTPLFKDNWRMSNVNVGPGASLLGPSADSLTVELQWGTFNNQGTVSLGDGSGGFCDLGLRGDWAQHNDYFFSGAGTWRIAGLLIGRNSSQLAPVPGSVVRLVVQRNFENYDVFLGKNGTGRIDVVMGGRYKQFLMGNTTETTAATTTFHNLEIDNANLASDWNNSADVLFASFGGGTINYFITGELLMRNGDLVTRHRTTNIVHPFTLRDSATTNLLFLHSNLNSVGSSFVDGPLRWEVQNASMVTRAFPLGKTKTVNGYQIGDARPIVLQVDHDATTRTTYTAEMFLDDRSSTYTWPSPIPEAITWISQQRYWNVTKGAGANVESALLTLSYDVLERQDGVTNAPALRIVKDNGLGDWINLTPLGPGGSANLTGYITSFPFNTFSDFTLASVDGNMPLPMELLSFEARPAANHIQLDWSTLVEINASHFMVERSQDREHFAPIGRVEAMGQGSRYAFQDHDLHSGNQQYFYRLRMVDVEGLYRNSEIRSVSLNAKDALSMEIWPNPNNGTVHIQLDGLPPERAVQITLVDQLGRTVMQKTLELGQDSDVLDLSKVPAGTYFVQVQAGQYYLSKLLLRQ